MKEDLETPHTPASEGEGEFKAPSDLNRYTAEQIEAEKAMSRQRWKSPPPKPRPLETLEEEVDFWMYASPVVRRWLRQFYALNPMRCTRLVEYVVNAARSGQLTMPDVYLGKRLKEELEEAGIPYD